MKTLQRHTPTFTFILLPLILASLSLARAQDADSEQPPPPPSPPYVPALTGDFTLVKKFTYLTPPDEHLTDAQKAGLNFLSPPSTKPDQVTMVKSGAVRKDSERFIDGSERDIWKVQQYLFTTYSTHPDGLTISLDDSLLPGSSPGASGVPTQFQAAHDFPELSWIVRSTFQGLQVVQGKKCYAYKLDDQTVWIDASTHLPVYIESKKLQVSYTFSGTPDEPLQLPHGYLEKLQKFKLAMAGKI